MAEKRYDVVFSGKLVEDRSPQDVLAKLCALLEMEQQQVLDIFREGFGALVCNDLEGARAYARREELREAGAVCIVREIASPLVPENSPGELRTMDAPRQVRPDQKAPQDTRQRRPPQQPGSKTGSGNGFLWIVILSAALAGGWWVYQTYLVQP